MKTTFYYTIFFCAFFVLISACKNKNSPPPLPPTPHGDSMAPSLGPKIFDTLEQQIKFPTSSTSSNIEIVVDEKGNMMWGDVPIKGAEDFRKKLTAEFQKREKQGTERPGLGVSGYLSEASNELYKVYDEVLASLYANGSGKKDKPKTKPKAPSKQPKSTQAQPLQVTQYENGTILFKGKKVGLDNLRKEIQRVLLTYNTIPDNVPRNSIGTVGMGMRQEVQTQIDEAISGAKWVRKKAALDALTTPISKKLTIPAQLAVSDYQIYANYAFVVATPQQTNGKPMDYTKTPFKTQYNAGSFADGVFGLLKFENGNWKVIDYSLGATDVPFGCWWKEHNVPKALFSKYKDVLCTGSSTTSALKPITVQFAKGKSDTYVTKTINPTSSIDFNMYAKKGQTLSFTIGYDFKDSDIEGFLTEPTLQDIALTTGPKSPNEFKVKITGNHRLTVHNTTKKNITMTLYVGIK
jgi:biopolymer transport protein ExbD